MLSGLHKFDRVFAIFTLGEGGSTGHSRIFPGFMYRNLKIGLGTWFKVNVPDFRYRDLHVLVSVPESRKDPWPVQANVDFRSGGGRNYFQGGWEVSTNYGLTPGLVSLNNWTRYNDLVSAFSIMTLRITVTEHVWYKPRVVLEFVFSNKLTDAVQTWL